MECDNNEDEEKKEVDNQNSARFMIKPTLSREWDNVLTLKEQQKYVALYELLTKFVDVIVIYEKITRIDQWGATQNGYAKEKFKRDWLQFEKVWKQKLLEAVEYVIVYQFPSHRYYVDQRNYGNDWNVEDICIFWEKFMMKYRRMQNQMEDWKKGEWSVKDIHEEFGLYWV